MAPAGYSDSYDHFKNFFNSVRTRKQPVEDAIFGFRAAGAALLEQSEHGSRRDRGLGPGRDETRVIGARASRRSMSKERLAEPQHGMRHVRLFERFHLLRSELN